MSFEWAVRVLSMPFGLYVFVELPLGPFALGGPRTIVLCVNTAHHVHLRADSSGRNIDGKWMRGKETTKTRRIEPNLIRMAQPNPIGYCLYVYTDKWAIHKRNHDESFPNGNARCSASDGHSDIIPVNSTVAPFNGRTDSFVSHLLLCKYARQSIQIQLSHSIIANARIYLPCILPIFRVPKIRHRSAKTRIVRYKLKSEIVYEPSFGPTAPGPIISFSFRLFGSTMSLMRLVVSWALLWLWFWCCLRRGLAVVCTCGVGVVVVAGRVISFNSGH